MFNHTAFLFLKPFGGISGILSSKIEDEKLVLYILEENAIHTSLVVLQMKLWPDRSTQEHTYIVFSSSSDLMLLVHLEMSHDCLLNHVEFAINNHRAIKRQVWWCPALTGIGAPAGQPALWQLLCL
jgi:hypothetical protein